jgi:hypothetical protein
MSVPLFLQLQFEVTHLILKFITLLEKLAQPDI